MSSRRILIATWTALVAGIFTAVLTLALSQGTGTMALITAVGSGAVSITTVAIIGSFLIVLATISVHYRRLAAVTDRVAWIYQLVGRIGAAILGAAFATTLCTLVLILLAESFPGGTLPIFSATLILTMAGAALGFVTAYIAVYLNTEQMLVLTGITLLLGLTAAALLADDRHWYANSLSFLGWNDGSNWLFDWALILGGLLILAVMGDVLRDLNEICTNGRITRRSYRIAQVLILAIGIGVILIGLFPTRLSTISFIIHQVSAWVVFGSLLFLMGGINWLLPIYPGWFVWFGRALVAGAVVAIGLHFIVNLLSFVALEIILIALVAPWCFLFAQQTDRLVTGEAFDLNLTPEFLRRVRFAAYTGAGMGILGAIAALLTVYRLEAVPVFSGDRHSLAAIGLFLSFPLALVTTAISYRRFSDLAHGRGHTIVVSLVVALLAALIVLAVSYILDATFTGVTVEPLAAAAWIGGIAFTVGFAIAYVAVYFNGFQELMLTAVVFGVGILMATTHAADPNWWQNSISFLGHDQGAFLVFSVTLILCGLLFIVVGTDLITVLEAWDEANPDRADLTKLGALRRVLRLMGIFIMGIGLFPTTITRLTNDLHNISSHGLLVAFLVLLFGVRRLVPIYPRSFFLTGYALGVATIANLVLYFAGGYNYVIMEFILVIILGTWLYLFFRYTRMLMGDEAAVRATMQPQVER